MTRSQFSETSMCQIPDPTRGKHQLGTNIADYVNSAKKHEVAMTSVSRPTFSSTSRRDNDLMYSFLFKRTSTKETTSTNQDYLARLQVSWRARGTSCSNFMVWRAIEKLCRHIHAPLSSNLQTSVMDVRTALLVRVHSWTC